MIVIHCRKHTETELGVWTETMAHYGQFEIVHREELVKLCELLKKLNIEFDCVVHHSECDGYDSSCDCPMLIE